MWALLSHFFSLNLRDRYLQQTHIESLPIWSDFTQFLEFIWEFELNTNTLLNLISSLDWILVLLGQLECCLLVVDILKHHYTLQARRNPRRMVTFFPHEMYFNLHSLCLDCLNCSFSYGLYELNFSIFLIHHRQQQKHITKKKNNMHQTFISIFHKYNQENLLPSSQ